MRVCEAAVPGVRLGPALAARWGVRVGCWALRALASWRSCAKRVLVWCWAGGLSAAYVRVGCRFVGRGVEGCGFAVVGFVGRGARSFGGGFVHGDCAGSSVLLAMTLWLWNGRGDRAADESRRRQSIRGSDASFCAKDLSASVPFSFAPPRLLPQIFCLRSTIQDHTMSDSEDGAGVPLIEPDFARSPSPGTGGKRKREDDSKLSKRAKKLKTKKPKNVDNEDLSEELGLNLAIGRMDSKLLADYMAQRTKRFEPDLSMVELEDRYVPGMLYVCAIHHFREVGLEIIATRAQLHGQLRSSSGRFWHFLHYTVASGQMLQCADLLQYLTN